MKRSLQTFSQGFEKLQDDTLSRMIPGLSDEVAGHCMRNILEKKFWVFDLDGTLTRAVHDFAYIRASLGIPAGADILGHLASLAYEHAQPLHDRLHEIELELVVKTGPSPGAPELVESLYNRGCRLGILTRNTRHIAALTLNHIGLARFFEHRSILGRDEAHPKPDPDGVFRLADRWHTLPADLVMVGDYLYDLQAGQAAGASTIHVHGNLDRRWPEWTDLCVESLQELADRVRQEQDILQFLDS